MNALFTVGADADKRMIDRVLVPYSMWKPWEKGGADAFWFDSGVHQISGTRIATVICYEQLLVWPVLHSFAHNPEILVGAANDWWARTFKCARTFAFYVLQNCPVDAMYKTHCLSLYIV